MNRHVCIIYSKTREVWKKNVKQRAKIYCSRFAYINIKAKKCELQLVGRNTTALPVHNKYKNIHAPWRTTKRGSQSSTSVSSKGGGSPGSVAHLCIERSKANESSACYVK